VLRHSRSFKVIDVSTNLKPVCNFLLVIKLTDILSRTVSKLLQIIQISDTLHFLAPFGGLGATYTVHPRLIGELIVNFLFGLIELFSLDFCLMRYQRVLI